jgi:hypothetical protein
LGQQSLLMRGGGGGFSISHDYGFNVIPHLQKKTSIN